jgi:hypothetical protein
MSKMSPHDPFGYLNTIYGKKKGRKSNCQFDFRSLKVENRPNLLVCRWCAIYHWKGLNEGYNFALDLTSIWGLYQNLWASKVTKVPISKISGLPTWESWTKWHLGVGLMAKHREYYKGEGGGFLQVWVVVSLMSLCLLVACPCTKGPSGMH